MDPPVGQPRLLPDHPRPPRVCRFTAKAGTFFDPTAGGLSFSSPWPTFFYTIPRLVLSSFPTSQRRSLFKPSHLRFGSYEYCGPASFCRNVFMSNFFSAGFPSLLLSSIRPLDHVLFMSSPPSEAFFFPFPSCPWAFHLSTPFPSFWIDLDSVFFSSVSFLCGAFHTAPGAWIPLGGWKGAPSSLRTIFFSCWAISSPSQGRSLLLHSWGSLEYTGSTSSLEVSLSSKFPLPQHPNGAMLPSFFFFISHLIFRCQ